MLFCCLPAYLPVCLASCSSYCYCAVTVENFIKILYPGIQYSFLWIPAQTKFQSITNSCSPDNWRTFVRLDFQPSVQQPSVCVFVWCILCASSRLISRTISYCRYINRGFIGYIEDNLLLRTIFIADNIYILPIYIVVYQYIAGYRW